MTRDEERQIEILEEFFEASSVYRQELYAYQADWSEYRVGRQRGHHKAFLARNPGYMKEYKRKRREKELALAKRREKDRARREAKS